MHWPVAWAGTEIVWYVEMLHPPQGIFLQGAVHLWLVSNSEPLLHCRVVQLALIGTSKPLHIDWAGAQPLRHKQSVQTHKTLLMNRTSNITLLLQKNK